MTTTNVICDVCRRALDIRTDMDGGSYQHALADQPADHDPVPVTAEPGWTGGRCDFCSTEQPEFELPARDFRIPDIVPAELMALVGLADQPIRMSRGNWAACATCAELLRADRWDLIEVRSVIGFLLVNGFPPDEFSQLMTMALHAELRQNVTGPLRPITREEG